MGYFLNKTIGLMCYRDKRDNDSVMKSLSKTAQAAGLSCVTMPESLSQLAPSLFDEYSKKLDFIVSLGGDGSVLEASELAARLNVPLLGVNNGRVGFLTEIEISEFEQTLSCIYSGNFALDKRMLLKCEALGLEYVNLNDFIVYKKSLSGVVQLEVKIDGMSTGEAFCDGIVVSTATGATAYSISAGGSIIAPGLDVLLVTPICPHSLCFKPIVASPDSIIEITAHSDSFLACAGENVNDIPAGTMVRLSRSELTCDFITLKKRNLYSLIRTKLT